MQAPIWVQKGMTFNDYVSKQPVPHTRKERVEYVNALREARDEWKAYLAEMQRQAQLEQLRKLLGVNILDESVVIEDDIAQVDADGVPVN